MVCTGTQMRLRIRDALHRTVQMGPQSRAKKLQRVSVVGAVKVR